MTRLSNTFLLFSIFIRQNLCQDTMEKQKAKQDLLVAVLCVFMLLLVLLIASCIFIHYKLISNATPTEKPTFPSTSNSTKNVLKSFSLQAHSVETRILLSPADAKKFATSPGTPPVPQPQPGPPSPTPEGSTVKPNQQSVCHVYRSHSDDSLHSDDSGSIYSLEHFHSLYGSSRSMSRESLCSTERRGEEPGGSDDSESVVLCAIHHEM
ncbi:uncharacterized protein LOC128335357 isoform X2 [Hemicordylus capensis]|uniref:uncharacterized protein LOC128335357 isoform X2 n=1 Tax=Hemicordylus capensis TaxID=884348 RepID=UPI0023048FEC|nr:uncharacterized protein LOC128335357 isoform X2 [Hemicordylus capensis]